jgi:hypothetical protein
MLEIGLVIPYRFLKKNLVPAIKESCNKGIM